MAGAAFSFAAAFSVGMLVASVGVRDFRGRCLWTGWGLRGWVGPPQKNTPQNDSNSGAAVLVVPTPWLEWRCGAFVTPEWAIRFFGPAAAVGDLPCKNPVQGLF